MFQVPVQSCCAVVGNQPVGMLLLFRVEADVSRSESKYRIGSSLSLSVTKSGKSVTFSRSSCKKDVTKAQKPS